MPPKLDEKKGELGKFQIVQRFLTSAVKNEIYPSGVIKLYRVTRTSNQPQSDYAYQTVRIRNPEELARVKPILDILASKLGWQELPPLLKVLEEELKQQERIISPELRKIVEQYPKASIAILRAFDESYRGKLDVEDFPLISEFVKTALQSLQGKQKSMIDAQLELLDRLTEEKSPEGIQRLLKLLQDYELPQLTTVTSIITDRLQKLRFFEREIQNNRAYEIRGENSIHNQLKSALWIIDDSFWLLHSNQPLTTFLHRRYSEAGKAEKERPDFICATSENRLVIVELKRPSHKVTRDDAIQLQDYLITTDEYSGPLFKEKVGYLIGNEISGHDQKFVDKMEGIKFKSYSQLVEECKRRYQEYLDAMQKAG